MRIALFTPYSPEIGGGSVQLRSHLGQLPELNVEWHYLAPSEVAGANRHWLGESLPPRQFAADLLARSGFLLGSTLPVRKIVREIDADLYWVVAHYEGVSVADELLAAGRPVHLTVHDEPLAMLIRSRRYRPLWPSMSCVFSRVLRSARSVDVISTKMRDYFRQKYGVDCFSLYRFLPELPTVGPRLSEDTLTVGHIGSLYHSGPFRNFILAARSYAAAQDRSLKIVRIGDSPEMDKVASENLAKFENYGERLEQDALSALARCDFVYAMYPRGFRFRGFRRTSLPMKLSTYIQAQRPMFAHTPADSGLAALIAKHSIGIVCSSNRRSDIQKAIKKLLSATITRQNFEAIRRELMGHRPLERLREALTNSAPNTPDRLSQPTLLGNHYKHRTRL
jgi:glycosyltransferase involved in cell wall biosynthesis